MEYDYKYQAAAAADVVVSSGPAILKGIIIGADVAAGVLEVSDHASDGDGNVKIKITSATMLADTGGYLEVNALFKTGITVDMTNQTDCTFIWKPFGLK